MYCNDKEGNLLTKETEVLERWKEYYSEILANKVDHEPETILSTTADDGVDVPPPTLEEIKMAIGRLKGNKSPGSDGIPAELIKHAGEEMPVQPVQHLPGDDNP